MKPATMFAFTATPLLWPEATVPKAPRWHPVNCVPFLPEYPGLALGAIVSRASRISDGMLASAASAVSSLVTVRQTGASLLPHIDDLRSVSATVAVAVAETADAEGLAGITFGDIVQQVQDAMWQPEYRRIQAS